MDIQHAFELAKAAIPAAIIHRGLEAVGGLALISKAVPTLLEKGVPAAASAADWVARAALSSPLKPVILWQAPALVTFLNSLTDALTKIADTFRDRLEADIKAAAVPPAEKKDDKAS